MSESENHHHGRNEVIIVKRHGGGDHEGGHGGAWKIAYASFMTAMMAFLPRSGCFNAANKETKASWPPSSIPSSSQTRSQLKKA